MGKRKHKEKDDNTIRRKIKRLERKLQRNKDRSRRSITRSESRSSSDSARYVSDDERSFSDMQIDNDFFREDYPESDAMLIAPPSPANVEVPAQSPILASVVVPGPASVPVQVAATTSDSDPVIDLLTAAPTSQAVVPDEILELLGQAKNVEERLGEKIPTEISERWGKILLDGLAKEQKEGLKEKMLIPENFLLARAPKLNPEVSAVLTEPVKNRDKRLEAAQNQLGSGIAGLVNLTRDLIQTDVPKLETIKKLSEVAQVLLDLHYEETLNRRKLLLPLLDKNFWSTTHGLKRETFLFGDNLGDSIKNSKDIERSSQQIKKPAGRQQRFQSKAPMSGNGRFPPRQQGNPKTAAAPSRYYEPQPSTSGRRNAPSSRRPPSPRNYKQAPASHRGRDQRRR